MGIIFRLFPLPPNTKGVTVPDPDGNYSIYLNQDLAPEMQIQAYLNEINHIKE